MWRDKRKKRVIYTIYSSLPVTHLFLKIFLHATIYWIFFKEEENFKDSITRSTLQLLHRHERAKLSKNNFRFQLNNASSLSQRMKKKKNESSFSWKFIATLTLTFAHGDGKIGEELLVDRKRRVSRVRASFPSLLRGGEN